MAKNKKVGGRGERGRRQGGREGEGGCAMIGRILVFRQRMAGWEAVFILALLLAVPG